CPSPFAPPSSPPSSLRRKQMGKLFPLDRSVLSHVRDDDAYWTGDIAYDCREATAKVRNALVRLEAAGMVSRVALGGKGYPTSWRRTLSGRAALEAQP